MFLYICKQTVNISGEGISQKVNGVIMRHLPHIIFTWRRRKRQIFIFAIVYLSCRFYEFRNMFCRHYDKQITAKIILEVNQKNFKFIQKLHICLLLIFIPANLLPGKKATKFALEQLQTHLASLSFLHIPKAFSVSF